MPILKKQRGGKRIGAGRKKKAPTQVLSFRVNKHQAVTLQKIIKDWITINR